MSKSLSLKVLSCTDSKIHPYEHYIYLGIKDIPAIQIKNYIFRTRYDPNLEESEIGTNLLQRNFLGINLDDQINIGLKVHENLIPLAYIKFSLSTKSKKSLQIDSKSFKTFLSKSLNGFSLYLNQEYAIEYLSDRYFLKIKDLTKPSSLRDVNYYFDPLVTQFEFINETPKYIQINDESRQQESLNLLLKPDFSFQEIGVGGLDQKFAEVFRRTFASRLIPPAVLRELGINHVKGMLLYGPPGTGKTRLARSLANLLGSKKDSVKVVNGPEVLNRFVGASEEKIRDLFKDAESEWKDKGDNASLHVIIFDEIDAICKARGSSNSPAADTIVNQLLTKIDGIESAPNVLIIGMTNRKELLDPALLRPGRLEIQLEVGIPDETGRSQILEIHTKNMKECGKLSEDVDLISIAGLTKNYTGAELEGVVKCAASLAILEAKDEKKEIMVCQRHFLKGCNEIKPVFGSPSTILEKMVMKNFGEEDNVDRCVDEIDEFFKTSKDTTYSFLIFGGKGSGKTSLAALLALRSGITCVKYISAKHLISFGNESAKINEIMRIVGEASKATESIIIFDDLERICEYISCGPRFSAGVSHAVSTIISTKNYENNNKMCFIYSASNTCLTFLDEIGLGCDNNYGF